MPRILVILLARVALGSAVVAALWTVVPPAFGWTSVVVVSGSMGPRIQPGDVVVATPVEAADVRPGQPVVAENPDKPGHLLMHRVMRRNADGSLVTKGDANEVADSDPVPASSVRALPRLLVRYIGLPLLWRSHGEYRKLAVTAAVLAVLLVIALQPDDPKRSRASRHQWAARHRGPRRRYRGPRRLYPGPRRLYPGPRRRRAGSVPVRAAVAGGAAVAAVMATGTAQANYNSVKSTGNNSWQSGYVTFGANSPAGSLFTINSAVAGSFGTKCVKLSYTGSLPAQVRVYVSSVTGGGFETYLGVQVRSGTGNSSTCSDFAATTTEYNATGLTDTSKTLAALQTASHDYATGAGTWNATTGATRTYQVSWLALPDNAATSRTVTFALTWEAQS